MSKETLGWLNGGNILAGYGQNPWWSKSWLQTGESPLYPGAIPVADVLRRLFSWEAKEGAVFARTGEVQDINLAHMVTLADQDTMAAYVLDRLGIAELVDRKAIFRSDNRHVMGLFTEIYLGHPFAEWLLNQVSTILGNTLGIGSAGLLRGGAVAWVSVQVPDSITTPEGVEFRPNLLACTSHDGSLATTYKRVVTNVVCDNTMNAALGEVGQQLKIRHTRSSQFRLTEAREALAIIHEVAETFEAQVRELCRVEVSKSEWARFVDAYTLTDAGGKLRDRKELSGRSLTMVNNKADALKKLWSQDDRVSPWAGTAYGVIQAVNTFGHHEGKVRGAHRAERNMLNAVTGKTDQMDIDTVAMLSRVLDRRLVTA